MSTNSERLFISKLAHSGGLERMMADGINSEHFSPEEKNIWEWMTDHLSMYGNCPSLSAVKTEFTDYHFESTSDSLPFLKKRFVDDFERKLVGDKLHEVARVLDDKEFTGSVNELLFQQWQEVAMLLPQTSKIFNFKDMFSRVKEYEKDKNLGILPGIPMGIKPIDDLTMGIQPYDYITVAGYTGMGKSTLVQWLLLNSYMNDKSPLFISLEMEPRQIMRRWDTMMTHFSYQRLKNMELTDEEVSKWKRVADEVAARKSNIRVANVLECSTETVYGLACRHKPDIIAIDYITLMKFNKGRGSSMWESVTDLSRELKMMARSLNIPIIGVAQTNRNSAESDPEIQHLAYSNSIAQDSDVVLSLGHRDDIMKANHQAKVLLKKNRDGSTGDCKLFWEMDTMTFREWRSTDIFRDRSHDDEDEG